DALLHSDALDNSVLKGQYPKLDDDFSWNTFYNMLGVLRLTNDASVNATRMANLKKALEEEKSRINKDDEKEVLRFKKKELCVPILEIYARELALPIVDFIQKYSYIRKMAEKNSGDLLRKLDNAALDVICEEIAISHELESEQSESDIIASILKMNVLKGKSEEGKLFVTTINGALSAIRENLYIAGLSSSKYPGSPREDYLLLDDDIDRFGSGASFLQSNEQIQIKRDNLMLLTSLSTALGVSINVSYAGMDVAELKKDNASSLIYELYKASNGKEANYEELEDSITSVDYFEPAISITREVGNAYNKEATITINDERITREEIKTKASLDRAFSPTAIGTFFNCPRQFFLQNIVGLYTPNDDKPFEVIATNEAGTLMHSVMEKMAETMMNLDDTLEYAGCLFDNFILEHPPLVEDSVQVERSRFLSMARYAYESDPGREVALAEEDIEAMHESGVKLHGLPDRVEKLDDGSYLVVDYKTSRKMSHEPDDVDTCFQLVVYEYLMESKGYNISGGEFRYLRLRQNIPCKYDDEMKELLNEKLVEFKKAMDNLDFPIPANAYEDNREKGDPDPCKFCKYGLVCGKLEKEGLEDE
ncbi:MAG: PD-(D/E)XK nuclease family protein, partial [Lachnospiraceae bacterium]|nr:PD-(D/E)XK nuclease family protein [Lachnospiraceae bacterium]